MKRNLPNAPRPRRTTNKLAIPNPVKKKVSIKKEEYIEGNTYTQEQLEYFMRTKQRIWCREYVIDWDSSRAARAAGYSPTSASQIGYENRKKPLLKAYCDMILQDLERLCNVSKQKNINELAKIAYSSIASLHLSWIKLKDFNELTEDQLAAIESTETKKVMVNQGSKDDPDMCEVEYVKIKLFPKLQAITEMNTMMGYKAPEKKEVTVKGDPFLELMKGASQND